MEELSDIAVRAKLNEALQALSRASAGVKGRQLIKDLKEPLKKAIDSFDTPPAPSPFPGDDDGGD